MSLVQNATKRKLRDGQMVLGFGLHHLRSIAAPLLAAAGRHDFLFIDMEHGAFTVQEATQLAIAALPTGITPLARVCAGALDEATRLLDNGALGIVVPHVDTASQASAIAEASAIRRKDGEAGAARRPCMATWPRTWPRRRPRSTTRS